MVQKTRLLSVSPFCLKKWRLLHLLSQKVACPPPLLFHGTEDTPPRRFMSQSVSHHSTLSLSLARSLSLLSLSTLSLSSLSLSLSLSLFVLVNGRSESSAGGSRRRTGRRSRRVLARSASISPHHWSGLPGLPRDRAQQAKRLTVPPPPSPLPPPRKCQRECQHVEQVVFCFLQCILPPFCILHLFLNLSVFSKAERQRRTDASGSESAPRSSSCPPSPRWDTLNSRCRRSHDSSLRKDCSTHPPSPFLAPS